MLNTLKKLNRKEKGFTIIEVMIVIVVAGLIMAIVLAVIPQLQRNQRNQARRDVVNRIRTEIDAFAGNNNGRVPQNAADMNGVYSRYLGCGGTAAAPTTCTVNINGASSGTPMPTNILTGTYATDTTLQASVQDQVSYQVNSNCDGERVVSATGTRNYAMWTQLEGGAVFCIDNN